MKRVFDSICQRAFGASMQGMLGGVHATRSSQGHALDRTALSDSAQDGILLAATVCVGSAWVGGAGSVDVRGMPIVMGLMMASLITGAAGDVAGPSSEDGVRYSQLWGEAGEKWSADGRLPDFSFAGYRFGEVSLPDVAVAADVTQFGARGDGQHDDTQAFKDAIAHTAAGVILIPPGRYVITDILDIRKPGIVLRGSGVDRTTLVCPTPLQAIRPNMGATTGGRPTSNYSWSGGIVWVRGSRDTRAARPVTSEAARGQTVVTVSAADDLVPGQRVCVEITDDAQRTLLDHLYAGDPGDTSKIVKPIKTRVVSRVAAVEGGRVTLERSLPFAVRLSWSPTLSVFDPDVSEVGIEAMSFEFPVTPYEGHFTEAGYNAIAINRASDCWVRDIHIRNADSGVYLTGTFCTLDGLTIDSQRQPHTGDRATGHHGVQMGMNCLAMNFDFQTHFIHDFTVDSANSRNVVKNGRGVNLSLDHHKRVPYANLFCNLDVGEGTDIWRCGGGEALGKHCAAWGTFWNIRAARPLDWPRRGFGPDMMNLVGLSTDKPSQLDPAGRWFEAIPPHQLHPADLHAAQLQRRLGRGR